MTVLHSMHRANSAGRQRGRVVLHRSPARRIASANLDLRLTLVAADKPDEATNVTLAAVTSGRLAPSNYWHASEVVAEIEDATLLPQRLSAMDTNQDRSTREGPGAKPAGRGVGLHPHKT